MATHSAGSRLSSLCFGTAVAGMILSIASVLWVTAGVASETELAAALLARPDTGTVQLPDGLNQMKERSPKYPGVDMSAGNQATARVMPVSNILRLAPLARAGRLAPNHGITRALFSEEPAVLSPEGTSFRSYGFYDPLTGAAIEDEVWTFDHGAPDSLEGWASKDITENAFTAFRRITAAIWSGHNNVPPAPVIAGSASVWLGWFEDEADAACWVAGLGYGNNWSQRITSDLFLSGTGKDTIEFDYFRNVESGFDFVRVLAVDAAGATLRVIATLTGAGGTPSAPLHYVDTVGVSASTTYRIRFEFTSDAGYSDEDGYYPTTIGAFGVDNIALSGGAVQQGSTPLTVDFESGLQGYVPEPIPGVGAQVGTALASSYTYGSSCGIPANGLAGNVIEFHDDTGQHPGVQHERLSSPAIPIAAYGNSPLNVIVETNNYFDMPGEVVFWWWHFTYYPYICPATGQPIWSPLQSAPFIFYTSSPQCKTTRVFANDTTSGGGVFDTGPMIVHSPGAVLIPNGVDSVKVHFDVLSTGGTPAGNFSPLFDNIRVIVSNRSTMHHVPSPAFPYIQAAIDAADPGDTVMVAAGEYTGGGNRNLDFGGKDIVLMSEAGAKVTIIDIQNGGRGIAFVSGETSASKVDGFTFRHGLVDNDVAGGIGMVDSDPTIVNCVIDSCTVRDYELQAGNGGGIFAANSASTFTNCEIRYNAAKNPGTFGRENGCGGGVYVFSGGPTFTDCVIEHNSAEGANNYIGLGGFGSGGGVYVREGATAMFAACEIAFNTTTDVGNRWEDEANGGGLAAWGTLVMSDCTIHDNTSDRNGGGVACHDTSSAGTLTNCEIYNNGAEMGAGLFAVEGISLVGCEIYDDTTSGEGGGIWCGGPITTDDCDIRHNTGRFGGGLYIASSGANFRSTRIWANIATNQGGAIYATSAATLDGCWVTGNYATWNGGGALATEHAGLGMTSCTVAGNRTGNNGGGVYVTTSGDASLTRTIVWGNDAATTGDQAFVDGAGALSFNCSLTDSSEVGGGGTITYVANNKYWDPLFCGPEPAASAPTTAGDYSVAANSPVTKFNSWCDASMGADTIGCPCGAVISIADVGNDQGRHVRIRWNRAMWDVYGASTPITQYSVWRLVQAGMSPPAIANVPMDRGNGVATALTANGTAAVGALRGEEVAGAQAPPTLGPMAPPGTWDFVTLVPASAEPTYSTVVPTLCDSTESAGQCWSTFFVRAHTSVPAIVFDCPPDSGYSVDNLAPGAPQNLMIDIPALASWSRNTQDADFDYFTVYCAQDLTTPFESAGIVAMTTDTSLTLPDSTQGMYIFVTAKDFAGNESEESNRVQNVSGTSVENPGVLPVETALHQNSPNPFNPTTTVGFEIASAEHATLRIYDAAGRLVRTLVEGNLPRGRHSAIWDGRDERGAPMASGIYVYRLEAGHFVATRKMVLLR